MLFALFVEGRNDFYFFREVIKTYKNYQPGNDDCDWRVLYLLNYFKTSKTIVLKKNNDFLVIIQGRGKHDATGTFLYMMKEFLNNVIVAKSILIIDSDKSPDPKNSIFEKIFQQKIHNLEKDKPKSFKRLLYTKLKSYPKELEIGIMDICPNLEIILSTFLRKYNVIPTPLTQEPDPHTVIDNAITNLKLDSYEDFCTYLVSQKNKELETELNQLCLLDTLCKIL